MMVYDDDDNDDDVLRNMYDVSCKLFDALCMYVFYIYIYIYLGLDINY